MYIPGSIFKCTQAPFNVYDPKILDELFKPFPSGQRLHCIMESTDFGYVLKYEYFNQFRALLNARKTRKGGFMMGGYQIEPAFDCSHHEQLTSNSSIKRDPQIWAAQVESGERKPSPKRQILQQLKTVFKPGHYQGVMDVAQDKVDIVSTVQKERLVIAEVEGNSIMNRFRFSTNSHLFEGGYLGALNITTNYVKCKPRKLMVHLNGTSSSLDKESDVSFDELSLQSKDPDWNNKYQIYELDFGGRVSQDSIKNFQIEKGGEVVSLNGFLLYYNNY